MAITKIQTGGIPALAVTHDKLHTDMDLSGKTVTLPTLSSLNITGNVGIGATPTARLDVRRDDASGKIAEFHQNTGYGIDIGSSQSVAYISSGYNQRLDFKTDPSSGQTERMSILSNGNVGIGTASPQLGSSWNKVLHVHSPDGLGSHIRFTDTTSGETGESGLYIGQYGNDAYLINRESGFMALRVNGTTDAIRITSSGNVGIGTNSPASPLHVNVGINQNLEIDSNGSELRLSAVNDARSTNPAIRFQAESYKFYGASGVGPRAIIDSSGNVGIGVTSPRNKLSLGNPHESPNDTDRILNWYDAGSELHNSNIYQAIVMDSNNTSQPGQIGIALANKNMQVGSWSPAITFGGRSQVGSGDYMNGGAAIASKNFTGSNDGNFIDSELHFFTKGSHTSSERNLSSKMKITGQGTVSITNGDLGHTHFTDKQGRYLTSNGGGWTSAHDGTDPGLVVSQYHTGTEVKNLGIVLHNDTSTQGAKSPTISFGAVSASTAYNTTYAHIVGNRRGTGADTNWASGDLEFYTQPDQGYTSLPNMTVHHGGQVSGSMNGRNFGISDNNWKTFGTLYGAQGTPLHIKVLVGHNSSGSYGEFTNDTYAYNIAAGTVVTIGNTSGAYTAQLRKIKRVGGVGFNSGDGGWEYQIARNQGYSFSVHMQVMGATDSWRWQV